MSRFLFLFFMLMAPQVFAQAYKIELELPQATQTNARLAYHYLGKIYTADSCMLDANGAGVWQGDSLLPQGLYKVYVDNKRHFDFLLGADQTFRLSNKTFKSYDATIEGSEETQEFIAYVRYLQAIKEESAQLGQKYKSAATAQEKNQIREQQKGLNGKMHSYWEDVAERLPDSFLSRFLWANYVPPLNISTLPESVQQNDSLLLHARFRYQYEHFWDNFDYTDERFLYTPFYKPKLETWFNKVLYPSYDSIKPAVYSFLEEVKPSKRIFQFATSFFLNSSINSKIMGVDALFVDLAKDYYLSGAAFWASEESLEKIRENVLFMQDNLIGKTAPDLTLESYDGEFFNLHQVESEITVVLIYEPGCSHCKVFIPEFYKEVYLPNKDKGLQVFAIYSMDDKQEWGEFLGEHDMFDWMNVWDPEHTTNFKIKYDGRHTPGVFVLDEDKTIIAKKMDVKGLGLLLKSKLN